MCSSRGICDGRNRSNRPPTSGSNGSGAHYALCALGVGLVALGMIMILWTVIPMDGESSNGSTTLSGNSTTVPDEEEEEEKESTKSSTVAIVLIGVGVALFILSIFLTVRGKRRTQNRSNQSAAAAVLLANNLPGQPQEP